MCAVPNMDVYYYYYYVLCKLISVNFGYFLLVLQLALYWSVSCVY